jgi:hypothetical protein
MKNRVMDTKVSTFDEYTRRGKLNGEVKADETYIGGKEKGEKENGKDKTGRGSKDKNLVVVATECNENR